MKKEERKTFDREQAERFLKILDPLEIDFTFQCFNFDRAIHPTLPMYGTLDALWDKLCSLNKKGFGVYVTINRTDGKGRKIENIKAVRAVWQEDDGEGKKLPIKPHLIVETSPDKYHRYILTKPKRIEKDQFDQVMNILVKQYGSDKNARDITRVLRVPGFFNVKPTLKEPFLVTIKKHREIKRLSWADIKKVFISGGVVSPERESTWSKEYSEQFDYSKAIDEISGARSYYQPLLSWSMFLANRKVPEEAIVALLKTALDLGKKKRPTQDLEIWQQRYDGIVQMAHAAVLKVRAENKEGNATVEEFNNAMVLGNDIRNETIDPIRYNIAPIITNSSINMIHATRGLGKTYLAMSMAAALGAGKSFLKWDKIKKAKVLYVDGELPYPRLKDQFNTACLSVGVAESDVTLMTGDKFPDRLFPDLTEGLNQKMADKAIMDGDFNVVFFDNIATIFKTSELKQESWKSVQDWLISLRTRGITCILIHHDNKAGDAQRGFSNKEDVMDTVLHLRKPLNMKDTDGAKFNISFSKHRYFGGLGSKEFGAELVTIGDGEFEKKGNKKEAGKICWVVSDNVHGNKYDMVVEYFKEGYVAREIARLLGVADSAVSKYKKKALSCGDITEDEILKATMYGPFDKKVKDDEEFDKKAKKEKKIADKKESLRLDRDSK